VPGFSKNSKNIASSVVSEFTLEDNEATLTISRAMQYALESQFHA
jgi:hypothetical protein